jgi:hypothetical protein
MARTRRRQGRIEYKQPDGTWSRTKPPSPKPSGKPAASGKPNPYMSGKPNPNAGGGVKGKPAPKGPLAAYKNDVAALKRLVKGKGPLAKAAAKRLASMGIRFAPGLAISGALAGSAGRPGAAQMSRLGLSPGRSTKSADAPTYKTPLNQGKPSKPEPAKSGGSASTTPPPEPKKGGTAPVNTNKGGGGGKPKGGSKPGFQYKAKDTLGKEIEGTQAFIKAHKDKKGAMQNAVKQAMERLKRLQEKQKRGSRVQSAQTKTGNLQISKANRNIG